MTWIRLLSSVLLASSIGRDVIAQPVNDDYARASVFDSASNMVTGTLVGATREPGEDPRFGFSVWWRWTAPSNGVFTFVAEADHFRPFLQIGPSATNLLVGLSNSVFLGLLAIDRPATEFPVNANQGTEYTIALFTYSNSVTAGDYALRMVPSAPPVVTFVQPAEYRTRHIVGEPLEVVADANDSDGKVVRVDFFIFSPGPGSITPKSSVASPPFRASVSTEGAIADRDSRLFAVAVDDVGLFGVAGNVVGQRADQIRSIAFRQPPPPNDTFAERVPLSGNVVRLEANNGGAGRETGEPVASGEQTLWWSWTAPATKSYYILARGLLSATQLSVFTASSLATLNAVASDGIGGCNDLAWVALQAQAGQTYALAVGDPCETFGGPLVLHILPTDAAPQIADARSRRAGEVANVPVFELFAVGIGAGWIAESSLDLSQWNPCDELFPYGWLDGAGNWVDTFRAPIDANGLPRFYRLRRTP